MSDTHTLLTPFQRKQLQKSLETELSSEYRRRLEIMLLADAGYSQAQICAKLGCAHATARYWIALAQSGSAHHWSDRPMGRPKTISPEFRDRLRELATHSPRNYGYSFQRWTATWLAKQLDKELGIKVSARYISQLLKQMGLSTRGQSTGFAENVSSDSLPEVAAAASRIRISDLQPTAIAELEPHVHQTKIS